jgi:hypothetical protein
MSVLLRVASSHKNFNELKVDESRRGFQSYGSESSYSYPCLTRLNFLCKKGSARFHSWFPVYCREIKIAWLYLMTFGVLTMLLRLIISLENANY